MDVQILKARRRDHTGTTAARQLRAEGLLPGIIYRRGQESIPIAVSQHDLEVELIHGQRVLSIDLDGQSGSYLIKEVQYDHLGTTPLHMDVIPVKLDEKITVEVTVVLKGTARGTKEGGVLEQVVNQVEIECLANNIPDELTAAVMELDIGDSLTVADILVPQGVKVLTPAEEVVATVRTVAEEAPAEEVEEQVETEPELIARGKAEEESAKEAP